MKEHKVSVDSKPHTINLSKIERQAPFPVEIDGKTYRVELLKELESVESFLVKVNGRTYKVELGEFSENTPFFVRVNNKPYKVQYETARKLSTTNRILEPNLLTPRKQTLTKSLIRKERTVTAPMPGIVVSLKVKVGDSVSLGQPLCILEAMKMENEITASTTGVIREIYVSEGSSVSQGQQIVVIE